MADGTTFCSTCGQGTLDSEEISSSEYIKTFIIPVVTSM
jgi:hypothetical protein